MLQNQGKKLIVNKVSQDKQPFDNERDIFTEKYENRNLMLIDYFKTKQVNNNKYDDVDEILWNYFETEIKQRIEVEINKENKLFNKK